MSSLNIQRQRHYSFLLSAFLHSHFHANRSVMNGKLVNSEIEEVLHRMLNVDKYMHLCKATRYSTATSKYQVLQMPIT